MLMDNVRMEVRKIIVRADENHKEIVKRAVELLTAKMDSLEYGHQVISWYFSEEVTACEFRDIVKKLKSTPSGVSAGNELEWCAKIAPHFYNED